MDDFLICAVSAGAFDLGILVLIICAYCEKRSAVKRWGRISADMELVEPGVTYPLGCDEILIGRHASADIRLADISVSRYHAMLSVTNGVWVIRDIGSKSGVYVNGNLVKEKKLSENDTITLGNRRLIFRKIRRKERNQ